MYSYKRTSDSTATLNFSIVFFPFLLFFFPFSSNFCFFSFSSNYTHELTPVYLYGMQMYYNYMCCRCVWRVWLFRKCLFLVRIQFRFDFNRIQFFCSTSIRMAFIVGGSFQPADIIIINNKEKQQQHVKYRFSFDGFNIRNDYHQPTKQWL